MDLLEKIEALIEPQGACGVWTGRLTGTTPVVDDGRASVSVRRRLWQAAHGPLGREFIVIGACSTTKCVRHLAVSTRSKAILKGTTRAAVNFIKTHCARGGHLLSGDNLHITPTGERQCRECNRLWVADWRRQHPERWAAIIARDATRHWSVRKSPPRIWTCNLAKFRESSPLTDEHIE
jgi:hypothetical protein